MRKITILIATLMVILFSGCGDRGIDEDKPVAEIAADVADMGKAELQKMVDQYEQLIAEKTAQLEALKEEIKEIPLKEIVGEKAKTLKAELSAATTSIDKLKNQLMVYADALAGK